MKISSLSETDENPFENISERITWGEDDSTEDENFDDSCPNCGREYDETDHEYQICHICHFENKK